MKHATVHLVGVLGNAIALSLISFLSSAQDLYRITEIGVLDGESRSVAVAMNASGQVAGNSETNGGGPAWQWNGTTIKKLGTLGYSSSATAINDVGQVTGYSTTLDGEQHAFVWERGMMLDLGTLGGISSEGRDINRSGQVTGVSTLAGETSSHAFLWDGSTMKDLGTLGGTGSSGNEINNKGQVAGTARLSNGQNRAFLWDGNRMRNLGTLAGGIRSNGQAINESGQVAGTSTTAGTNRLSLFIWDGATLNNLGNLGDTSMKVDAMNASGQIVGLSQDPFVSGVGPQDYAFLWNGATLQRLDALDNCFAPISEAFAINAAGHAVGNACGAGPFLWDGTQQLRISNLVDPQDPLKPHVVFGTFTTIGAVDINARGQIAINGLDDRYQEGTTTRSQIRAFLLTPMEYQLQFVAPASNSNWKRTASIPVKIALVDRKGRRITDTRANSLISDPCKVKFSANGAQSKAPVCMKYNATTNEFSFNWTPGATAATGATNLLGAATYKFSMPQMITTSKSRAITITQ